MSTLTLHLHGPPHVAGEHGQRWPLEPRAAALCALVALWPEVPRQTAAAWLWPESADPRRNLRQQLLRFRQQCGRPLLDGEPGLALADGVTLAEGDGELLPGQPDGGDDFGHWLAQQRHALAARRHGEWQRALAAAEAAGDLDQALALAQAVVGRDPGHEAGWQALMRVHCLRGEAAAGLAAYASLQRCLAQQQGREPSASSQALALSLIHI